jgi:two-component system, OmpR family, sensor histidine kinase QseC
MRFVPFRWRHSLAVQLLCTYVTALILTTCCVGCAIWFGFNRQAGVTTQAQLRKATDLVHRSLRFDSPAFPGVVVSLPSDLSRAFHDFSADLKYRVLDASGSGIVSSENTAVALAPPGQPFDSTRNSFTLGSGGETLHVRTESMVHGANTYYIQVAMSERLTALTQSLSARFLIINTMRFALASIVLFTVAVYFTLRKVLMPLRETSAAASRIDAHNISKRLSTHKLPIEFLPVVEAFNLTLDRLEKGYIVQRAFLAGAAHELKTPLALIRAQIEMEATTDRKVLLHDLDLMARQVNQLLHLAEASETQNYVFEFVDVVLVAEDVVGYLARLAERRAVYVDIRCAPGMPALQADRGALFMLLKNLVENAIQHSPVSGVVALTIDTDHLCIRDEGPGIPAGNLPKLFTRFWRGETRRNEGAGLGLSICQEIAATHKWGLAARSTGHGAEFTLSFRVNTATSTEGALPTASTAEAYGIHGSVSMP